jgi:hypothetical protein
VLFAGGRRQFVFAVLNRAAGDSSAAFEEGIAERTKEEESEEDKPPGDLGAVVLSPVMLLLGHGGGRRGMCGNGLGAAEERIRRIGELAAWITPMTEVVHQLGGFDGIETAGGEGGKDLRIGVTGIDHASGKFHIGRQDFVYHI